MEQQDDVAIIVRTMSTKQNKCKLKHCFTLHYGTREELCTQCEEDSIVEAHFG